MLLAVTTLLFFLLRLTGDPAVTLAGPDATPEQLASIRTAYGLDRPIAVQYVTYLGNLAQLDFGESLASGEAALVEVLARLPATLLLAVLAIGTTMLVSAPLGAWLGSRPQAAAQRAVGGIVFVAQGVPGFVFGLLLIQIFAVELRWLPSLGFDDPVSWVLPTATLAAFLTPKLTRVVAANVAEAMGEDYIRTARAQGASPREVLWRHALPNALLGAAALLGTQFAYLMSGSLLVETIFAWPGVGWLLLESTRTLDFPVVQAIAIVTAILVFCVNALVDRLFQTLDPRLAKRRQ
jgi:peptide/nickel transport system permease protein